MGPRPAPKSVRAMDQASAFFVAGPGPKCTMCALWVEPQLHGLVLVLSMDFCGLLPYIGLGSTLIRLGWGG